MNTDDAGGAVTGGGLDTGALFSGTGQGSQTSEGDATHGAAAARSLYGANGTGVKIGVLSNGSQSNCSLIETLQSTTCPLPGTANFESQMNTALMALAAALMRLSIPLLPVAIPFTATITLDGRVLIFAVVIALAVSAVVGLLPARIDTDRVRELDGLSADPEATRAANESRIPLRRYGTPDEFGRVAAFLLSPAASYLTGIMVPVDGGMRHGF